MDENLLYAVLAHHGRPFPFPDGRSGKRWDAVLTPTLHYDPLTGLPRTHGDTWLAPNLIPWELRMHTSAHSDYLHCSRITSLPSRTAVCGPVRTVVWQGAAGDCRPYADQTPQRFESTDFRRARVWGGVRQGGAAASAAMNAHGVTGDHSSQPPREE